MAKKIIVYNEKGGAGKTSTAVNLMASLKLKGKSVLGIDIDPQGSLTKNLNVNTHDENTILEMVRNKKPATFEETVVTTSSGDLIPCDKALQINLVAFAQDPEFLDRIKNILKPLDEKYDYIIIDCNPAINHITYAFLCAVDYLLIPTEAEMFSLDGVSELYRTLTSIQDEENAGLKALGILICKYQPRRVLTKEAEEVLGEAAKLFKSIVFDTKIKFSVDIPSAQALRMNVLEYRPKCEVSEQFLALADEVIKGTNKNGKR